MLIDMSTNQKIRGSSRVLVPGDDQSRQGYQIYEAGENLTGFQVRSLERMTLPMTRLAYEPSCGSWTLQTGKYGKTA